MKAPRIFAFAAALVLSAALAFGPHAALALGSTPVTVTNPSVPVTVGNPDDPTAFAKAQNAIRHPFFLTNTCTFSFNQCQFIFDFHTSNPSQAIIVEYVAGSCEVSTGAQLTVAQLELPGPPPLFTVNIFIPTPDHSGVQFPSGGGVIPFAQSLHLPLPADTAVTLLTSAVNASNGNACFLTVTGEAIDQ